MRITRLTPTDAADYRALMLHAYSADLDSFTSTVAEREPLPLPLEWWAARIVEAAAVHDPPELVVGAFDGVRLVGLAGLMFERRERTLHKSTLFGMFVLPGFRRQGTARALVKDVLQQARQSCGTEVVQLTVTQSNADRISQLPLLWRAGIAGDLLMHAHTRSRQARRPDHWASPDLSQETP